MKAPQILVIDDEAALRQILKKLLVRKGYVVNTAAEGREALEKLKAHSYQLIITDLRMPVKGGTAMLTEVERGHPAIKVIIVTGYPLDPAIQEKVQQGRYAYLAKPFENTELMNKVKELIG